MNIKIVYETQTGTTQYVAEIMRDHLIKLGHTVNLHSLRLDGQELEIEQYDMLLFGAPTYEDGKLEQTMRVFTARFAADLSKHKVAVFGLGNRVYPQFCTSATLLEDWVKQRGALPLVPALKIDGFPDDTTQITQWLEKLHAESHH